MCIYNQATVFATNDESVTGKKLTLINGTMVNKFNGVHTKLVAVAIAISPVLRPDADASAIVINVVTNGKGKTPPTAPTPTAHARSCGRVFPDDSCSLILFMKD